MNNYTAYNYVYKIRENYNQNKCLGGGVSIGIDKLLTYKDFSVFIPGTLKCFDRILILTVH
jgi:hypothetical protein